MSKEWEERRLDEITECIIDCPHSTPKWTDKGVIVIRNQNIRNGRLDLSNPSYTNQSGYESRIKRAKLKAGDLVLTREAPMGEVCIIPKDLKCCLGQRMVLVRPDLKFVDPVYLLFAFQSSYVQHQISWNEGTGTTVSNIRLPNIYGFQFNLPPLPEQKAIAHILGKLDDKIELNRQMNQTLEQMAQALFQSWFVDFDPVLDNALAAGNPIPEELATKAEKRLCRHSALDAESPELPNEIKALFPNSFTYNETLAKWIPEGWEVKNVEDSLVVNPKVSIKKGEVVKFTDMKALPTSGYSVDSVIEKEFIGGAKFNKGDVLLARITPCLQNGKTAIVDFLEEYESGFGSTEFIVFRGKEDLKTSFVACLARFDAFVNHCIQNMVGSSGRQRVMNSCFSSYFLTLPPNDVLQKFDDLTKSNFSKITSNSNQTTVLTQLRDTLLPQLISGKLRVPEVMLEVNEVVG